MPEYILGTRTITLRPADVIGSGGEADVFRKGKRAYKVFKPPSHPDLAATPQLQQAAADRIALHQKKLPVFPHNLPGRVIAPLELLRDTRGTVVGYEMELLSGADELMLFGERSFREQGATDEAVRQIFIDLYRTVQALHQAHIVIGDFNDLNVLVKGTEAYLVDADSMQFGSFAANMFTAKFVDPLICDSNAPAPMMIKSHNPNSDWYAYIIMLMQSLLFVGPYGGVYRPKDHKLLVPHEVRPLKRITVFNPEVRYPKPARSYKILPDDLLSYFEQVFVHDMRGMPPLSLIENLRFTTCSKCGKVHARGQCPDCVGITPIMQKEVHTGTVQGVRIFRTEGRILYAAMQKGMLHYLYHHNDAYRRDGGRVVVEAALDPRIRFRIRDNDTLLAMRDTCLVFEDGKAAPTSISVDAYGNLSLIDANATGIFFTDGGGLFRSSELGLGYRERIADVLPNQTLFWAGETLGFGFYRAAEICTFFIFRPAYRGINDSTTIPRIQGQLIDSTCVFGQDRIWFFTTTQEGSNARNRCVLIDVSGTLLGSAEATPGDGTWLGNIRGATAARDFLLVPTDDGVVKVALNGASLSVTKEYPDTARFVDASANLFIGNDGLFVVRRNDIWRLVIT